MPLWIYEGCSDWKVETKIKKEDITMLKNTISYIQENFDKIYQAMLEALLPFVTNWGMENRQTQEKVTTIEHLHDKIESLNQFIF